MKKIVSFDFDGTLAKTEYPKIIAPIESVIAYARQCIDEGCLLILNTMREGKALDEAVEWCEKQGITFDAVNDNVQIMKEFYANNPRKIFANEYIDDHNLFFGGVGEIRNDVYVRFIKNYLKMMPKVYRKRNMNLVVVRDLLMNGTSTAGMTSCIEMCREIGVDPYVYELK